MKNKIWVASLGILLIATSASAFAVNSTASGVGVLGTPADGSTVSGIGVISGYHCTSEDIDIYIDGISLGKAGAGTTLLGTQSVCGRTNTGYSLLYNFNNLQPGQHVVEAYANGIFLESHNFYSVQSGGVPWLSGASKTITVQDFPSSGQTATLEWVQSLQNFLVTNIVAPPSEPVNKTLSARMIGGTWTFSFTIGSTPFQDFYTLTSADSTATTDGIYYVRGSGEYNDPIISSYSSSSSKWSLLDPGTIIDRFFTFTFSDDNHVSGCYYQINPPGSTNLSRCYPMTGVRSANVGSSLQYSAAASASVTPLATEELEMREVTEDTVPGFIEPGALEILRSLQ